MNDLDGDGAPQRVLDAPVDPAHPADPNELLDEVRSTDRATDQRIPGARWVLLRSERRSAGRAEPIAVVGGSSTLMAARHGGRVYP